MIDVHPPHQPVHGWRDFVIHLSIITIGLLIALSLEGLVEWEHHRHLVREADDSLRTEIQHNAESVQKALAEVHKEQAVLKQDTVVLKYISKHQKPPSNSSLEITFHISDLQSVSWLTAQSTGALAYMPYASAQQYADIYSTQALLATAQQQAARDAIVSLGPFADADDDAQDPTNGQADSIRQKIDVLQGQLLLVDSLLKSLDGSYKKFQAAHAG